MAERRPLTARDVKSNVEGYSEMSDEAFARRFYSDRAELLALGVPLQSQRDEFTGEELYTLRSENYFLDELELDDDELAALQTALYLLEGKFAYAEPLRLALQNLALGRPGFDEPASDTAVRAEVLDPDYTPEMPGRLGKLEGAISKQRTIKFPYYSISRNRQSGRTTNPYALPTDTGSWHVTGQAPPPPPRQDGLGERPAGPVVPERFAVLQALLAYLLAACGEGTDAVIPANEIVERFHIPEDQLEEHLQLLNLVNFGGGCYTVYAALEGQSVHVDKELYGDTFRLAPRLTPLEARAIRLALEFVGPMIAADAHTPLDRVRK